jgi:hypothetical protein
MENSPNTTNKILLSHIKTLIKLFRIQKQAENRDQYNQIVKDMKKQYPNFTQENLKELDKKILEKKREYRDLMIKTIETSLATDSDMAYCYFLFTQENDNKNVLRNISIAKTLKIEFIHKKNPANDIERTAAAVGLSEIFQNNKIQIKRGDFIIDINDLQEHLENLATNQPLINGKIEIIKNQSFTEEKITILEQIKDQILHEIKQNIENSNKGPDNALCEYQIANSNESIPLLQRPKNLPRKILNQIKSNTPCCNII